MTPTYFDLAESFEKIAESVSTGIFDLLHTGVALMSASGNFLYCNRAFLSMYNLSSEVIGRHVTEVFVTGEQGLMNCLHSREAIVSSSLTVDNEVGISFRYPVKDREGNLRGAIIESISTDLGKEKLNSLMETVRNLEEASQYFEQNKFKHVGRLYTFADIVGESSALLEMKRLGQRFAASQEPILLCGESGTGKELVAQALHMVSPRADKAFVAVNCAALPPELIESELFGYASGAFTGARAGGLTGKFEMADGGTIFLDEIGELPLAMQAKLLRVLESGEIQKIGHRGRLYSDFRLIGATNRDLARMVREGQFREDLYHRLNIFEIVVPPLRERLDDIPLLVRYFIEQHAGGRRAKEIRIDREVYRLLGSYTWPGNIRELKNVLTYALYSMTDGDVLRVEDLPARFITGVRTCSEEKEAAPQVPVNVPAPARERHKLSDVSADAEKEAIARALLRHRYNKSLAAQTLGISRNKLYKKLREYGLLETDTEEER